MHLMFLNALLSLWFVFLYEISIQRNVLEKTHITCEDLLCEHTDIRVTRNSFNVSKCPAFFMVCIPL